MKLKPCPFCGESATIERYGNHRFSTQYSCDYCGCFLETGEEWNHGTDWNTRVSDWLSITKNYSPTKSGNYWCFLGKADPSLNRQKVCFYDAETKKFCDDEVTHWMLLPEEPTE